MTPRKDSDFYKLKHAYEKVCYLNGMPKTFITLPEREPEFTNFTGNGKVITATLQRKTYESLKTNWGPSHTAFWMAYPHDREALAACCQTIRHHAKENNFRSFEFISPFEDLRFLQPGSDADDIRELYVLLGASDKDPELTNRVRRWLRQPNGATIWVVGTAQNPYLWASEELGVVPDYMFFLKKAGISRG